MDKDVGVHQKEEARVLGGERMDELVPGIDLAAFGQLHCASAEGVVVGMLAHLRVEYFPSHRRRSVRATIGQAEDFTLPATPVQFLEKGLFEDGLKRRAYAGLFVPRHNADGDVD